MGSVRQDVDLFPSDLQFSVFSTDDIKKLSSARIITGLTFDALGHPLPGGLYDAAMGTYGRSMDACATCCSISYCPGHLGHIELNVKVYNPFFVRLIRDILKIACLNCHKIQMKDHLISIITLQFKLAEAGYLTEAKEMEIFKSEYICQNSDDLIKTETGDMYHPYIAQMREILQQGKKNAIIDTKASYAVRSSLINSALQNPTWKKCIHCNKLLKRVRYLNKKLVLYLTKEELKEEGHSNEFRSAGNHKVFLPDECEEHLRDIYSKYSEFLNLLFPILNIASKSNNQPIDTLFMDCIPVTPPKVRPTNLVNNQIVEHPITSLYRKIIENNNVLRIIMMNMKNVATSFSEEAKAVYETCKGDTPHDKMYFAWQDLQTSVDFLIDTDASRDLKTGGLKQVLEKKEGLIRKHMMGKRVNYAARTVITPDPNISVEEVGVPDIFARRLSYPVPVTPWNVAELRKMVMNGPNIHPGANFIEDEKGFTSLIPHDNPAKRESLAKLLFIYPESGTKIVHRHLLNGDILLMNRQPSLHKPSIMAHKVRILPGEKTFRLHYSNCKAYNADFDGDEMNAHFPQNEVARSEAYNLVNVANNYLVPKDGTPLGGLIQDHVISGVKLSMRGRFFNREDYHQLVFQGLPDIKGDIKLLPPAIMKPIALWSGKQILSTIIINIIPKGYPAINLTSKAKIGSKQWQINGKKERRIDLGDNELCESEVIIRNGELLVGVLDKQQYGATQYGLVHCVYELYGGKVSSKLLTALTKVFTFFLQREGFTLGIHDILVTSEADKKRKKLIDQSRKIGNTIVASVLELDEESTTLNNLAEKMEEAYVTNPKFRIILDRKYKSILDGYTNDINKACLPGGLISKFPSNNLQLMVLSGAKGSMVNTMQISCLLGQIELEGKRPPLMISGKSLPSFPAFETSPKSGGFIDGRFMTGIQPQDFFFHCMAGREGLIDTAVKTSRSGYLQRCLIKHLEGLKVDYDLTVRDSDKTVVQFLYGEDGLDILKSTFFNEKCLQFLVENASVILREDHFKKIKDDTTMQTCAKHVKSIEKWKRRQIKAKQKNCNYKLRSVFTHFSAELKNDIEITNEKEMKLHKKTGRLKISESLAKLWIKADAESKEKYRKKCAKCPDPTISKYNPDRFYGSVSENILKLIRSYAEKYPNREEIISNIMYAKYIQSLANPGESVGLLAAQSIGEPSTQMTLNTFHFAGRGEMNVTLGIPRLREILMLASKNIKTPSMDIPVLPNQIKAAEKLRITLNRVTLADVLEYVKVKRRLTLNPLANQYQIYFQFLPREAYDDDFCVRPKRILKKMSTSFFKLLFRAIIKSSKNKTTMVDMEAEKPTNKAATDQRDFLDDNPEKEGTVREVEDDLAADKDSSDEEMNEDENDATGIKLKNRKIDETEYDEPEVDEEINDANEEIDEDNAAANNDLENSVELNEGLEEDDEETIEQIERVMDNEMVIDYKYDRVKHLWCKITFNLPIKYRNPDMTNVIREICKKFVLHEVNKIKRAIMYKNKDELTLKTDGINIVEMFEYNKILDLKRLYSNDIHAIARTYGIEAAAKVIVQEVQNVFKVYGITVDPRHLSLIADYMTFDGTFKPLSRKGMEFSSSPLQQMSFESCMQFLKSATVFGHEDNLKSPSSRLMVGLPVENGTGCFDLLSKISYK